MSKTWTVNTRGKNATWLINKFGGGAYKVIVDAATYGYHISTPQSIDTYEPKYVVDRIEYDACLQKTTREFLGEFSTATDAIDMLRLLVATRKNEED